MEKLEGWGSLPDTNALHMQVSTRQLEFEGAPLRMLPKLAFIQQKIDDRHAKVRGHLSEDSARPLHIVMCIVLLGS